MSYNSALFNTFLLNVREVELKIQAYITICVIR